MAAGYTKEFLVNAFVSRYESTFKSVEERNKYVEMASNFYDEKGKDKFRVYCSLDADALKLYKASLK